MAVIVVVLVEVLFDATSSSPIASMGRCDDRGVVESAGSNMVVDVDNDDKDDDANATDQRHGCKRRKVPMGLSIRERRA